MAEAVMAAVKSEKDRPAHSLQYTAQSQAYGDVQGDDDMSAPGHPNASALLPGADSAPEKVLIGTRIRKSSKVGQHGARPQRLASPCCAARGHLARAPHTLQGHPGFVQFWLWPLCDVLRAGYVACWACVRGVQCERVCCLPLRAAVCERQSM
jgi:hypothetical protein